jgi:hypothetical protein
MFNARIILTLGVFLFGLMQGCTMVQTYPLAARSGDTITIAPGSLDGANKTNLIVEYYSDSNPSVPINLTSNIRSVFNITPDRTSSAWLNSSAQLIPLGSGHGPWQTVIALNLPSGLPLGSGNLRVSLGAGVTVPTTAHTPEGVDMALEILPGTGTSNPFSYRPYPWDNVNITIGNLSDLVPGRQYVVKPDLADTSSPGFYGAAEYTLFMPLRNKDDGLPPTDADVTTYLTVILDSHPNNDVYQVALHWHRSGDNIIVDIISPLGYVTDRQTRFSVVIDKTGPFMFSGSASILSVNYFDTDGNVVATTPVPLLQGINL